MIGGRQMSFQGFIVSCIIILFLFFFICGAIMVVAIKIKIKRRKEQNQYYKDIHRIAEHLDKK